MSDHELTRREFVKRSAAFTLLAGGGSSFLAACGGDGDGGGGGGDTREDVLARARSEGFIRVGFANEAPYGFADPAGKLTGAAPELARRVFTDLGVKELQGVLTEFASLIPGVQAKRFDAIVAGQFINAERCQEILFADPFYCALQAFAVKKGNPLGIERYEDVAAKKVRLGVLSGAVEGDQAKDAGVSAGQISVFPDPVSGFEGVQAGRVDAFALTSISIKWQIKQQPESGLEATEPFTATVGGEPQIGCGGFGFRKEDSALRNAFNDKLLELMKNGEAAKIVTPFGFSAEEVSEALNHPAEELCAA